MSERTKNFCQNRKYLIALVILVLLGAGWIYLLLDRHIYPVNPYDPHLEQRIAFVSLWVAIVGFSLAVAGTVIAVLQFQASQRKPDLHLWIGQVGKDRVTLAQRSQRVKLVLENQGNGVARHVKCRVWFCLPKYEGASGMVRRVEISQDVSRYWEAYWSRPSRRPDHFVAGFSGGNDYICYDKDWDTLGIFRLRQRGLEKARYEVKYELRCEGMPRREGVLWAEVSEDARA
ncbi:MAG: hypothetical protein ACOC6F_01480 [bacterium]